MTRALRLGCVFASILGASVYAGCGTATTLEETDTGPGSGSDTGITIGRDTGITVLNDTGTMPGNDSGTITVFDAGPPPPLVDSGRPPRPDAGMPMTGTDSGTTMGVMCGGAVCGAAEVCCITRGAGGMMISQACTAPAACTGIPASCDGPEDCATGEACCGSGGIGGMGSAMCTPEAMCGFIRLCHVTADCPNAGDTCCSFMGASVCSPRCF